MSVFNTPSLLFLFVILAQNVYGQLWKQYSDSAVFYNEQQNTDKAVRFYIKAREELKTDSLGTNSYARICNRLGILYQNEGQFEKAEPLYLEANHIREHAFGKVSTQYAESCYRLADLYLESGQYQKAESFFKEAMQICEKVLGRNDPFFLAISSGLADLYRTTGKYEKAEALYLEVQKISEQVHGKEHENYIAAVNNLGNLYFNAGQYQKAESLYQEAWKVCGKVLGKGHYKYAQSCNNLANIYFETGRYEQAEALYVENKSYYEKGSGKGNPGYARACSNLAALYQKVGQYEKSELLYEEAKYIFGKVFGEAYPEYATACNNLAGLYGTMGWYEKAEPLLIQAKQLRKQKFGVQHPEYAQSCRNLALLYYRMGQYKKAEPLYLEAEQVEKRLGKERSEYASSCHGLGLIYSDMGQIKKAESFYLKAKAIWEKVLGAAHPEYAMVCDNLALLYRELGQYEKAEPLHVLAKKIREQTFGVQHPEYAQSCLNLANLFWKQNKPEKAVELYAEAYRSLNDQLKMVFQFISEGEKQQYVNKTSHFKNYLYSFYRSFQPQGNFGLPYDVSLSQRNLILHSSQQLRQDVYTSKDSSLRHIYNEWMTVREQMAFWYTKPVANRVDYINKLEQEANSLEKKLTRLSASFRKANAQNAVSWKEVQDSLKPQEAAIEFVTFNFHNGQRQTDSAYYMALLVKRDEPEPLCIPLFESRQLSQLIHTGNTLNTVAALYRNSDLPAAAFNLIWKPLEPHLAGINKIYFAPAGLLYRISFAALPMGNRQVLSDKYQLIQLNTTAGVLSKAPFSAGMKDKIYLYGGIRYDADSAELVSAVARLRSADKEKKSYFLFNENGRGPLWSFLPGTEKEVKEIQQLGKEKKYAPVVFGNTAATEESIKSLDGAMAPEMLHIATHGFFFPDPKQKRKEERSGDSFGGAFRRSDNPLFRSGLLFAGANNSWKGKPIGGIDDGVLTAYEVANLYLPNTKLVVLSACETGLGEIQGNEGVYGLQRAFRMAGVKYLVMSLWKIPDLVAAEFMQEFYREVFKQQPIPDAFHQAQSILKHRYRQDPYRWAAWVLVQ